ncbi:MAG: hypothetical protein ACYDFT_08880 [Thermoplasmata archaeon]
MAERLHPPALRAAERGDGKWVLLAADPERTVKEVVESYLEKDFIEKVNRRMRMEEELEPVRHRLKRRVRAYLFVLTLAYRLWAALQGYAESRGKRMGEPLGGVRGLAQSAGLGGAGRDRPGKQRRVWYPNLMKETKERMKKLGYGGVLWETAEPVPIA